MQTRWRNFKEARASIKSYFINSIIYVWSIDVIGPCGSFHGMKHILVAVDYVSKWVEAIELPNNEGNSVTTFLKKNIFSRFGTLGPVLVMVALTFVISCSKGYWINMGFSIMWSLLNPQTSGQVELSNRHIKPILAKMVNANRTNCSRRLDDAR